LIEGVLKRVLRTSSFCPKGERETLNKEWCRNCGMMSFLSCTPHQIFLEYQLPDVKCV